MLVGTYESYLVIMSHSKRDVVKKLCAVLALKADVLNYENFITNLPVRTEIDIGIFPAGRLDLIKLYLFQGTLTGCCLL